MPCKPIFPHIWWQNAKCNCVCIMRQLWHGGPWGADPPRISGRKVGGVRSASSTETPQWCKIVSGGAFLFPDRN